MAQTITSRVAVEADFEKLTPLLKANCTRVQYEWSNYEASSRMILANKEYGFFIIAEAGDQVVGFVSFTFEWSDWRDGAFYWMQGMQFDSSADNAAVITSMKAGLEAYNATSDYKYCGIRICNQKTLHTEFEQAISAFELQPTHYYIYHIDTAN